VHADDEDTGDDGDAFARVLRFVDSGAPPAGERYPCPYLPDRQARMRGFRAQALPGALYHALMDRGFRRNGDVFYAMACDDCRQCVPLRVPVATFAPTRSQRRAWRRNHDVELRVQRPQFTPAKWELYRHYLQAQHGTSASGEDAADFAASLYADVVDTREATYWLGDRLVAVTILDVCAASVSSVYHWFDPAEARRSLGVFSVLAEIAWTAQQRIPHYYLGYWIEGAPTMHYKADYGPHELLRAGRWQAPPR
jgi:arginyl-tRNA--protein-N-Asp/Glu arginylyltransferase